MNEFAECERFSGHVRQGKRALDGQHASDLVETANKVIRSLNFEAAVRGFMPTLKRWDYFVEVASRPGIVHAVEMHNFEPTALKQKRDGTRSILRASCEDTLNSIGSWQVVIKGEAPRADIAARFRADTGINIAGRKLQLSKL